MSYHTSKLSSGHKFSDSFDLEYARSLLLAEVKTHPFWSSKAARRMELSHERLDLIYLYELTSFCQRRTIEWKFEPYEDNGVSAPRGAMDFPCPRSINAKEGTFSKLEFVMPPPEVADQLVEECLLSSSRNPVNWCSVKNGAGDCSFTEVGQDLGKVTSCSSSSSFSVCSSLQSSQVTHQACKPPSSSMVSETDSLRSTNESSTNPISHRPSEEPSTWFDLSKSRLVWLQEVALAKNETTGSYEMPDTSFVKVCFACRGRGSWPCKSCSSKGDTCCLSCHGRGSFNVLARDYDKKKDRHDYGTVRKKRRNYDDDDDSDDDDDDDDDDGYDPTAWVERSCLNCDSSGRLNCHSCSGDGSLECKICQGKKLLRCYLVLIVSKIAHHDKATIYDHHDNLNDNYNHDMSNKQQQQQEEEEEELNQQQTNVIDKLDYNNNNGRQSSIEGLTIPRQIIKAKSGQTLMAEQLIMHPAGYPVLSLDRLVSENHLKESVAIEIRSISQHLIDQHRVSFQDERLLSRKHRICRIRCNVIRYRWKGKTGLFFIHGNQDSIHIDNYPFRRLCNIV